ncbi:helix-turn-helix domain-containing protein [Limosilactobacillus oris]|uniref:helix-turn-helix domain-containing protein n=1 Tax=Limosilactobacillus oris TaxID=1632 RepID=UPI002235B11F|nr:helix-turn-helix transcriptional regulator [Limosilactobacillus oris]MCW4387024.1 helix-turn-helix transcriptional regulator [Limosilactobacillus oris]
MRNRIDEVLKEQGKTYKDLVPLTGLSEYVIGQMAKAGDDETFGAWLSIARALSVSPAYLVGWSDDPSDGDHRYNFAGLNKYADEHLIDAPKLPPRIPSGGTKITLDNGQVIYSPRPLEDIYDDITISNPGWLTISECTIATNHIASIAKVEED